MKLRYFDYEQCCYYTASEEMTIKETKELYKSLKNVLFNNRGTEEQRYAKFTILEEKND